MLARGSRLNSYEVIAPLGRSLVAGVALALLALAVRLVWAWTTPPLNAPDEPAYLQAVMEVRGGRVLPEIHFDFTKNWAGEVVGVPGDEAARDWMTTLGVVDPIRRLAYENVQPPLYLLVAGAAARLVPADPRSVLQAARVVSAVFGAATVFSCWAAARRLAPSAPVWAAATAGFVAFLPELCFIDARAGNDALVNCLGAAAFYVWFRALEDPGYDPTLLGAGALVGLALLSKLTAVVLLPGLALVALFRATSPCDAARRAAGAAAGVLATSGWWFVRNLIVYGEPSGTAAANRFWRLNLPPFHWHDAAARWDFVRATWLSFWGFFGWQDLPMPEWFYRQASWLSVLAAALSAAAGARALARLKERRAPMPAPASRGALLMAVTTACLLFVFVRYSMTVALQAQGRYFYLALLPAALVFTGGFQALPRAPAAKWIAAALPLLWLAAMNAAALARVR